ncbi:MAG: hypothetical protein IJ565_04490 [Bacilli bacterium]|nr:hypothetical protein [Bacilli bacterium]
MKKNKKIINLLLALSLLVPTIVLAEPEEPPGGFGGNPGGAPGGMSTSTSSYNNYAGATTLTEGTLDAQTYTSTEESENALLVSMGTVTLTNPTVTKSGDASGDEADFYGTNAAILAYDDSILNITNGTVTTNGSHANAVFAYGTGTINISGTTIVTSSNNSGGIMVTGGGTLTATKLTVTTSGNSSAAIRSDRGGGTMNVTGGTYTTKGNGSPSIYSTADINVTNATLKSEASEGIVIEGSNSVTLSNVTVIDNNTTLNGNSETYKNIFIYQSMSGDASEGTGTFTATNSTFTTQNGDAFFVTNTQAIINLTNNTFTTQNGDFLRVQTGKWGTSGSNGGDVTLNLDKQKIEGNIIVDNISTLAMNMTNASYYKGIINGANTAKNISLTLSSDSVFILNGDTYIDSLTNASSNNSNIYANGYTLYVAGEEVSINQGTYQEPVSETEEVEEQEDKKETNYIVYITIAVAVIIILSVLSIATMTSKNKE